jgi:hypothetical protein
VWDADWTQSSTASSSQATVVVEPTVNDVLNISAIGYTVYAPTGSRDTRVFEATISSFDVPQMIWNVTFNISAALPGDVISNNSIRIALNWTDGVVTHTSVVAGTSPFYTNQAAVDVHWSIQSNDGCCSRVLVIELVDSTGVASHSTSQVQWIVGSIQWSLSQPDQCVSNVLTAAAASSAADAYTGHMRQVNTLDVSVRYANSIPWAVNSIGSSIRAIVHSLWQNSNIRLAPYTESISAGNPLTDGIHGSVIPVDATRVWYTGCDGKYEERAAVVVEASPSDAHVWLDPSVLLLPSAVSLDLSFGQSASFEDTISVSRNTVWLAGSIGAVNEALEYVRFRESDTVFRHQYTVAMTAWLQQQSAVSTTPTAPLLGSAGAKQWINSSRTSSSTITWTIAPTNSTTAPHVHTCIDSTAAIATGDSDAIGMVHIAAGGNTSLTGMSAICPLVTLRRACSYVLAASPDHAYVSDSDCSVRVQMQSESITFSLPDAAVWQSQVSVHAGEWSNTSWIEFSASLQVVNALLAANITAHAASSVVFADMTHAWAMYIRRNESSSSSDVVLHSSVSLSLTAERVHKAPGGVFISASVLPVISEAPTIAISSSNVSIIATVDSSIGTISIADSADWRLVHTGEVPTPTDDQDGTIGSEFSWYRITVTSQQGNLILKLLNTSDTGVWFKGDLIGVQLVFEGSIDHVNTALQQLRVFAPLNATAIDTVSVRADRLRQRVTGARMSSSHIAPEDSSARCNISVDIATRKSVEIPPMRVVSALPEYFDTTEDSLRVLQPSIVFASSNMSDTLEVELTVSRGELLLSPASSVLVNQTVTDRNITSMHLFGTVTTINSALNNLTFAWHSPHGSGASRTDLVLGSELTVIVRSTDGFFATTERAVIRVAHTNDGPVIDRWPSTLVIENDAEVALWNSTLVSVSDPDVSLHPQGMLTAIINCTVGQLALRQTDGVIVADGNVANAGHQVPATGYFTAIHSLWTTSLIATGPTRALNTALASLVYRPPYGYSGSSRVWLWMTDNGFTSSSTKFVTINATTSGSLQQLFATAAFLNSAKSAAAFTDITRIVPTQQWLPYIRVAASRHLVNVSSSADVGNHSVVCSGMPFWSTMPSAPYTAGDRVQRAGDVYECKPAPFSVRCSDIDYAPAGGRSSDAWRHVSPCFGPSVSGAPLPAMTVGTTSHSAALSGAGLIQIDMFSRYGYITIASNDTTSAYDSVNVTIDRVSGVDNSSQCASQDASASCSMFVRDCSARVQFLTTSYTNASHVLSSALYHAQPVHFCGMDVIWIEVSSPNAPNVAPVRTMLHVWVACRPTESDVVMQVYEPVIYSDSSSDMTIATLGHYASTPQALYLNVSLLTQVNADGRSNSDTTISSKSYGLQSLNISLHQTDPAVILKRHIAHRNDSAQQTVHACDGNWMEHELYPFAHGSDSRLCDGTGVTACSPSASLLEVPRWRIDDILCDYQCSMHSSCGAVDLVASTVSDVCHCDSTRTLPSATSSILQLYWMHIRMQYSKFRVVSPSSQSAFESSLSLVGTMEQLQLHLSHLQLAGGDANSLDRSVLQSFISQTGMNDTLSIWMDKLVGLHSSASDGTSMDVSSSISQHISTVVSTRLANVTANVSVAATACPLPYSVVYSVPPAAVAASAFVRLDQCTGVSNSVQSSFIFADANVSLTSDIWTTYVMARQRLASAAASTVSPLVLEVQIQCSYCTLYANQNSSVASVSYGNNTSRLVVATNATAAAFTQWLHANVALIVPTVQTYRGSILAARAGRGGTVTDEPTLMRASVSGQSTGQYNNVTSRLSEPFTGMDSISMRLRWVVASGSEGASSATTEASGAFGPHCSKVFGWSRAAPPLVFNADYSNCTTMSLTAYTSIVNVTATNMTEAAVGFTSAMSIRMLSSFAEESDSLTSYGYSNALVYISINATQGGSLWFPDSACDAIGRDGSIRFDEPSQWRDSASSGYRSESADLPMGVGTCILHSYRTTQLAFVATARAAHGMIRHMLYAAPTTAISNFATASAAACSASKGQLLDTIEWSLMESRTLLVSAASDSSTIMSLISNTDLSRASPAMQWHTVDTAVTRIKLDCP